jgi:hypothetical protein
MLFVDGGNNRVGIGTDSPAAQLDISSTTGATLRLSRDDDTTTPDDSLGKIEFYTNEGDGARVGAYIQATNQETYGRTSDLRFGVSQGISAAASEALRIDAGGNVLVGKTSDSNTVNGITLRADGAGRFTTAGTSSFVQLAFFRNGSDSEVGSILTTSSATSYVTSSDYRLKENVVPMTGSIDRVKALKPSRFNFIVDADKTVDGFLAHEAQTVVPECVTGTKDAMRDEEYEVTAAVYEDVTTPAVEAVDAVLDADGLVITEAVEAVAETTESVLVTEAVMGTRSVPDMQGIDQSKLVPLLTAALQEAIARIEALEAV